MRILLPVMALLLAGCEDRSDYTDRISDEVETWEALVVDAPPSAVLGEANSRRDAPTVTYEDEVDLGAQAEGTSEN